ncbi:hypothetical protein [Streptomyces sp. NPDC059402]
MSAFPQRLPTLLGVVIGAAAVRADPGPTTGRRVRLPLPTLSDIP